MSWRHVHRRDLTILLGVLSTSIASLSAMRFPRYSPVSSVPFLKFKTSRIPNSPGPSSIDPLTQILRPSFLTTLDLTTTTPGSLTGFKNLVVIVAVNA